MNKVFILEHCFCKAYQFDTYHEIVKVCTNYDSAKKAYDKIRKEIENKTSHYFKDNERGWLNPILEGDTKEDAKALGYYDAVYYSWIDDSGEKNFTRFTITEYTVED